MMIANAHTKDEAKDRSALSDRPARPPLTAKPRGPYNSHIERQRVVGGVLDR
jgi:hypothetical protein